MKNNVNDRPLPFIDIIWPPDIVLAGREARENACIIAPVKFLNQYARQRDRDSMLKEAFDSVRKITNRLAKHEADLRHYHKADEVDKVAFR